jgi:membrane-associated phospholipid phosphatase
MIKQQVLRSLFHILFLILFFFPSSAQSDSASIPLDTVVQQATGADSLYRLNGRYLKSYLLDFREVVTGPARWQGRDWKRLGIITGTGTLLLVFADRDVRSWTLNNQKEALQSGTAIVEPFGNRLPPVLITGMYLTGLITGNRKLQHSSLSITRAVLISTGLYTATKSIVRRQRPVRTDNPYLFALPFSHVGYTSFPSGHSNTVFAVATAFALEYKEHKWVPWVVYPIAALTSIARIYENRHWTSDVLVGASFGHFITRAVYKAEEKRKQEKRYRMALP